MVIKDDYKHKGARIKLAEELARKGIVDEAVLNAITAVPRHYFFHPTFYAQAYLDKAFPIGEGQTISQPYTVAFQTQLLHIKKGDKVLEIGTGSGYQAAVLMQLGAKLYSIERIEKLHTKSARILKYMGYNPILKCGDGTKGWEENAPFDKIIVTAGAPIIPEALKAQLKVGGTMVIPVGDMKKQQMISMIKKADCSFNEIVWNDFAFVPLLGEEGWK
jgi:protein-L-isoaspartate(D-aspartate) O-methyltransferase